MRRALAAAAITLVVTSVVYMPVCNLAFRCGCTWPWLGGVEHCNIHVPGPPDCPVCKGGAPTQAAGFGVIASPIFAATYAAARRLAKRR